MSNTSVGARDLEQWVRQNGWPMSFNATIERWPRITHAGGVLYYYWPDDKMRVAILNAHEHFGASWYKATYVLQESGRLRVFSVISWHPNQEYIILDEVTPGPYFSRREPTTRTFFLDVTEAVR